MYNTSPGAVRAATGADGYFTEQQPPSDSAARPSAQPELLSSAEYAEVSNGTNAYSGLLTQEEAAEFLGCSKPHLASRCKDVPSVLIGRRRFYKPDDLLAWKAARASEIKIIQRLGGTYERHARNYKGDIRRLEQAIYEIAVKHWPMTVRQLFYQLVVLSLISKDLRGYNQVVALLRNMRDAAYDPSIKVSVEIPIHWIIDNSRRNTERQSFISPKGALEWIIRIYRKDFWHNKSERVLVIVEKDALAGTLFDVTEQYDVPIIVPRGYSSISYVARLVEEIARWEDQDIFLYYFADLDPSGQDAARAFEDRLRMMLDPDSRDRILVHNAAITFDQVKNTIYGPPVGT
jgi:hypothetical protein